MANMRMFCDFIVAFLCLGCVAPTLGITAFGNSPDLRRQISFTQQGQILSDVQQHQHRFSFNQNPLGDTSRQIPNGFIQQSVSQNSQPSAFNGNQQLFVQQTPAFQPLPSQSSPLLSQSQLIFQQPLVTGNQAFLPQPPLSQSQQDLQSSLQFQQNVGQQIQPFVPLQQVNGHQHIASQQISSFNNNQLPVQSPTQHSFLPTIPTQPTQQTTKYNFENIANSQQNSQKILNSLPSVAPTQNLIPRQNNGQLPFQNTLGSSQIFSSGQNTQLQSLFEEQRQQDLERLRDLQERQKIIQKHKQFLERQQQKQQQKVLKLHEDFALKQKKKQEEIYATARPETEFSLNTQARPRGILPHEVSLFQKALKQYDDLHPTTTPLTTTTTSTTTPRPVTKSRTRQRAKSRSESDNPELFLQSNRQKIYKELKSILKEDDAKDDSNDSDPEIAAPGKLQYIERQDLLKQLKLAIAENSQEINGKNFTSREISLPNGQKFEVIRTSDPNLIAGATPLSGDSSMLSQIISNSPNQIRPSKTTKESFEDLTKDVLPPGADFEVIKQDGNGKLEGVGKLPPNLANQKNVKFVFIEEQGDGSYKVKGVKGGNGEQTKEGQTQDVDSILKKIKDGEISLPPPTKRPKVATTKSPPISSTRDTTYSTRGVSKYTQPTTSAKTINYEDFEATKLNTPVTQSPKYYNSASPSSLSINHNGSPSPTVSLTYDSTTPISTISYDTSRTSSDVEQNSPSSVYYTQSPSTTVNGHQMYSTKKHRFDTTSGPTYTTSGQTVEYSQTPEFTSPTASSYQADTISIVPSSSTYYPSTNLVQRSTTPKSVPETAGSQISFSTSSNPGLIETLKENGLFATAKYLKQSGLDAILNETGPYTVFAPTDKAFRTLLIQLGGPDKAEEKFKENPRLLSGLLLHHVIPGAFEIATLQDEMTGVSLAGTQLRVNQYAMHDVEWNEIKVTTVNGARVISEKQDINIPQGIAHAVDRVMFPLPVGDIIQTLQADRERRFTNFLKALFSSGLTETLSDTKTFTVFAPTDRAFASFKSDELQKLVTDKETAKDLVMKHITPGTLFSAGMRYYQVKDSMEEGKPITLQKSAGRIKVNSGHVITHNIPTTNGVIHAVDALL